MKWSTDWDERQIQDKQFRDRQRNSILKMTYGITLEQFNTRLAEQGGVCKMCGGLNTKVNCKGRINNLSVKVKDGVIIGLYCAKCVRKL